jgi:3-carboxy-cis,cis-muconate cycloisomerase
VALAEAEAAEGVIPKDAARAIAKALAGFEPDTEALRAGVSRDGLIVPALVAELKNALGKPHAAHLHFGTTSQDLIDTSLALRLLPILDRFGERLDEICAALDRLNARDGKIAVMAHTRMQAAVPVTAARKILSWRDPLQRHRERLQSIHAAIGVLHFGGAAGALEKLEPKKAAAVAKRMAKKLGLTVLPRARHSERDDIVALASWLSMVTGSLGKIGQDIALLAQSEVGEIKLASGGTSSAMPHKVNPVQAETLVTLARFNATLVSGMHHTLVHENERSGAMWTLEWLLLPQMLAATGAALRIAAEFLPTISFRETAGKG